MTKKVCQIGGCEKVHYSRDLCRSHYRQLPDVRAARNKTRREKYVPTPPRHRSDCKIDGCSKEYWAKDMCHYHYQKSLPNLRVCTVDGCDKPHKALGLCALHYAGTPHQKKKRHISKKKWRQIPEVKAKESAYDYTYCRTEKGKARMRAFNRTLKGKFKTSKFNAKVRDLEWGLTLEQFAEINSKSCYYCGHHLPEAGSGLDRVDNSKGYVANNVVPCCTECNRARLDQFTSEEMKCHVGPAIKALKDERIVIGFLTAKILLEGVSLVQS
jgi:hypothetical protein